MCARYYKGNVWPKDVPELKEFESTFKASVPTLLNPESEGSVYVMEYVAEGNRLGKLIYDVGIALSKACEPFGKSLHTAIRRESGLTE